MRGISRAKLVATFGGAVVLVLILASVGSKKTDPLPKVSKNSNVSREKAISSSFNRLISSMNKDSRRDFALESKLTALKFINNAEVHKIFDQKWSFKESYKSPRLTIMLDLKESVVLDRELVDRLKIIVASHKKRYKKSEIQITDTNGKMLTAASKSEDEKKIENSLKRRASITRNLDKILKNLLKGRSYFHAIKNLNSSPDAPFSLTVVVDDDNLTRDQQRSLEALLWHALSDVDPGRDKIAVKNGFGQKIEKSQYANVAIIIFAFLFLIVSIVTVRKRRAKKDTEDLELLTPRTVEEYEKMYQNVSSIQKFSIEQKPEQIAEQRTMSESHLKELFKKNPSLLFRVAKQWFSLKESEEKKDRKMANRM